MTLPLTPRTLALGRYGHWIAWLLVIHQLVIVPSSSGSSSVVWAERATHVDGSNSAPKDALSPYSNYETMEFPPPWVPVRHYDDYLLTRRLGTGKFSDVFEAVDVQKAQSLSQSPSETHPTTNTDDTTIDPRTLCVIKCLKPVSERKIRREMLVLHRASALRNLARLQAIVLDRDGSGSTTGLPNSNDTSSTPRMPSLVLEHAGPHAEWLCHPAMLFSSESCRHADNTDHGGYLDDYELRYYLFHLLIAIDGLHSVGIMHRDIKPRNVLINRRTSTPLDGTTTSGGGGSSGTTGYSPLMLIDLGLADFHIPGTVYNVRVASRHYKSPELLVGYERYDCAIDMWGFGCIMAGLLLRREPFFRGKDNVDQLGKILSVLGTDDLLFFLLKYKVQVTPDVEKEIIKYHALQRQQRNERNGQSLAMEHGKELALLDCRAADCPIPCREAMDLLLRLLVYDHGDRWTAQQAMAHPYFDPVRHRISQRPVVPPSSATAAASTRRRRSKPPLES
jgi:casein kinase II subunit alpha